MSDPKGPDDDEGACPSCGWQACWCAESEDSAAETPRPDAPVGPVLEEVPCTPRPADSPEDPDARPGEFSPWPGALAGASAIGLVGTTIVAALEPRLQTPTVAFLLIVAWGLLGLAFPGHRRPW